MCARFKYRVDLWSEYLKACIQMASRKNFYRVFSNAIRFNAKAVKLWLIGIYYEFDINRNPFKGRNLFLRSLKLNPNSSEIWAEYFRFECKFVKLIEERQDLLTGDSKKTEAAIETEEDEGFLAFDDEGLASTIDLNR